MHAAIGEDGFARLCGAFYRRVRADDLLGPMYPAGEWEQAEVRLRDFLVFRFGGPPRYLHQRGHPRLRMRHGPFPIDEAAAVRWLELMSAALAEARLDPAAARTLWDFFVPTAQFMINRADGPPPD